MSAGSIKKRARLLLGVTERDDMDKIRRVYHGLAKKYHPDHNGGDENLTNQFKLISEAYEILSGEKNTGRYLIAKTGMQPSENASDAADTPDTPFGDEAYWDWWKERYGDLF